MSECSVCSAQEIRDAFVDEVFHVDGRWVLVGGIPAEVCMRCGEQSFSPDTAEKVRLMVHGEAKAITSVSMQVYDFASSAS